MTGILFILKTGIAWGDLPVECGWGCGIACEGYPRRWQRRGLRQRVHEVLLVELRAADRIDSASVRVPRGGQDTGPNPWIAGSWVANTTS